MTGKHTRPPKHETDPDIVKRLIHSLTAGNYIDDACEYAGIDDSTYYRWMKRGRDELANIQAGHAPNDAETPYREICESVKRARAEATVRNVTLIQDAARGGSWQAAAWWLERTNPEKWGRRTLIAGHDNGPVRVAVSPEDVDQKLMGMIAAVKASEEERESGRASSGTP